jgi:nucleoside-diphosphate-sugar epimerase
MEGGLVTQRRTLVTGGLGFVGSHLVETLSAGGETVTVLDDLSSPAVEPELFDERVTVWTGDAAELSPEDGPFDRIYHLADIAGPARVITYAGDIATMCVRNCTAALRAASAWSARLLVVSSSEVYGRQGRFDEADEMVIPSTYTARLEYAVGKALSEVSTMNAARARQLDVNIVRPFNIAGPRQSGAGGFVIPRFFAAALAGAPLEVFDGGRQHRAFCHVLDTVESLIAVMDSDATGEIFNSGNRANATTIGALAERVLAVVGGPSEIVHCDGREVFGPLYAESFEKVPNTAKINRCLGWAASRSLDQVLGDVHRSLTGTEAKSA